MPQIFKTITMIAVMMFSSLCFASSDNVSDTGGYIYSVKIDGVLTSGTASFVDAALKTAAKDINAKVVLITLNTPGGVLDATRDIVTYIMSSPIPVVVYVGPAGARAASAGMFVTIAADYALMAEGTNIGAAHPVNSGGADIEGEMGKKVTNDTVALARTIAQKRGRNIREIEKMVTESLSLTSAEALKLKVIDGVAYDEKTLKAMIINKFNINENSEIKDFQMTFVQKVSDFLSNPDILIALLFIGIIMIALEFKIPGTFLFAGIGAVSLILFAIGANIIPINFMALFLVLLGVGLLIAEIFVTSFGLLTIGGIVSLLFGMRMLFDGGENMGIVVSPWLMFMIIGTVVAIILVLGRLIVKDLIKRPVTGMDSMYNKHAKVIEWSGKNGRIEIYSEIWNAVSESELSVGDEVVITSSKDLLLRVKKVD